MMFQGQGGCGIEVEKKGESRPLFHRIEVRQKSKLEQLAPHVAKGDLESEAAEFKQQAAKAGVPEGGANLLGQ